MDWLKRCFWLKYDWANHGICFWGIKSGCMCVGYVYDCSWRPLRVCGTVQYLYSLTASALAWWRWPLCSLALFCSFIHSHSLNSQSCILTTHKQKWALNKYRNIDQLFIIYNIFLWLFLSLSLSHCFTYGALLETARSLRVFKVHEREADVIRMFRYLLENLTRVNVRGRIETSQVLDNTISEIAVC